ncbi:hypothetical protein V6N12_045324 [Hibiscus sabdariffa]|uniref:Uncharacterized protein n=1 Tax=Hibiscus sabdariffa TaxID=183260 RepID=A0ABR2G2F6_9ROSI
MASNSCLQQLGEVEFTPEERGEIFTPLLDWDSTTVDKGKQPKIHTNDEEEKTNVKGTIFLNHNNENSLDAEPFTNAPTDPTGHASTVAAQVDTIGALSPTPLRVIKQSIKNAIDPAPAKGVIPADKADSTLEKDMGKSSQPTSDMLVEFEDSISKFHHTMQQLAKVPWPYPPPRGAKRRSPMVDTTKHKRTRPLPPSSNDKTMMSSRKNTPAEVNVQPRLGK